jgi:2-(3-amino-3-carboxypropyl)histidine synthase
VLDIKIDTVKKVVDDNGYRRVIVLLPSGVMARVSELLDVIPEPVFMSTPCYGACDVPVRLLKKLGADAIFNFGHSRPKDIPFPDNVHFFEIQVRGDVPEFIPDFKRVGLVYVIQYKDSVAEYVKKLGKAGRKVVLGGAPDFMATYDAQVTGCDIGAARSIAGEVDGFVVASDGLFHANAVASLGKPTFNWFGETAEAPKYPMAALFAARKVAILTGMKPGQNYPEEAEKAREKLEEMGKKVIMIATDVITPEINNFPVDFWITAACPRIPEDDYISPSAPVQEVLKYL